MTDPTLRADALRCAAYAVLAGLVLAAARPLLTRDAPASLASHRARETRR